MTKFFRVAAFAAATTAALALSSCSSNDSGASTNTSSSSSAAAAPAPATTSSAASSSGVTTADQVFGPACGQLPKGDAAGGLTAMGPEPVATAASTNPLLTKLVAAVGAVPGLADTLNSTDNLTVFAPYDGAFDKLGAATFKSLAAAPSKLAPILQEHVVAMRYDKDGLMAAKTVKSLNANGKELTIAGSGDNITVNGAKVLCGNIPTKNATVFVIDTVLTP